MPATTSISTGLNFLFFFTESQMISNITTYHQAKKRILKLNIQIWQLAPLNMFLVEKMFFFVASARQT